MLEPPGLFSIQSNYFIVFVKLHVFNKQKFERET